MAQLRAALVLFGIVAGAFVPDLVRGQQSPAPSSGGGDVFGLAALLGVVATFVILIVVLAKLLDLKRRRGENEAMVIQSQVSDALLRDGRSAEFVVTPSVRVPHWSGTPVTLDLAGRVPTAELHEAVLGIATSEAARLRSDVVVEDRMVEVPKGSAWAA
jgi:hypothetical protein